MPRKYRCEKDPIDFCFCEECFKKQLIIDKQKEELQQLKRQLRYRKKKDNKEYFGSSTPSSKLKFKENSKEENQGKVGGRKSGHSDNGRKKWKESEVDEVIDLNVEITECPDCGGRLESKGIDYRNVLDSVIVEAKKILYKCQVKSCQKCRKKVTRKPVILPAFTYSNSLIANAAIMHYLEGVPLNRVAQLFGNGVSSSALIKIFHYLAEKWDTTYDALKEAYRTDPVKHADETGWRTDGKSGYTWLFCTNTISLFLFGKNRSAETPKSILGTEKIPGVLGVDRYGGYNRVPCSIQYCYAHLLRDVKDIEKKFPKNKEIVRFVSDFTPLLTEAMQLRRDAISDEQFYKKASEIKSKIQALARAPSQHAAIQTYQSIFVETENRLFHWADDRRVPADNNRAERELRPTIIARKVSFGSQSEKGAHTRSVLMSVFHSVAKRLEHQTIKQWVVSVLDQLADDPDISLAALLPNP